MALDASDLVDSFLDDQARVNSAVDTGDVNSLIADFGALSGELIGMQADAIATSTTSPPHKWDDGQSFWGFGQWP